MSWEIQVYQLSYCLVSVACLPFSSNSSYQIIQWSEFIFVLFNVFYVLTFVLGHGRHPFTIIIMACIWIPFDFWFYNDLLGWVCSCLIWYVLLSYLYNQTRSAFFHCHQVLFDEDVHCYSLFSQMWSFVWAPISFCSQMNCFQTRLAGLLILAGALWHWLWEIFKKKGHK